MPRKKKSKSKDGSRVYIKVFATFKCSKENCGKVWNSAHGWQRNDMEGIECESCNMNADLVNAVDEMIKLDNYNCPNKNCDGNSWCSIHDGQLALQKCDICEMLVHPEKNPQERFGRHYWFACKNKECKNQQEWEDFSLEAQNTQRCTRCHSRGDIKKIQKLNPQPWLMRRRRGGGGGGGEGDGDRPGRPTSHNSEFCDMCQKIRRSGKGGSCHAYMKVVTQLENTEGGIAETIISAVVRN